MDVVKDFEEKGAKPKIYGIPAYKTEDKKMEKQHPTASTPIHDNLATADFVTQPLVIFQQWVIRRHCYQTCRDHMGTCP